MATPGQIKLIHTAKSKLGLNDDEYKDILKQMFNVESSKQISVKEAEELMSLFYGMGFERKSKTAAGNWRNGYASPKQIRYIKYLWKSSPVVRNRSAGALNVFIRRIVKVDEISWLKSDKVPAVIQAIKMLR